MYAASISAGTDRRVMARRLCIDLPAPSPEGPRLPDVPRVPDGLPKERLTA
jgi:hypothetical protein